MGEAADHIIFALTFESGGLLTLALLVVAVELLTESSDPGVEVATDEDLAVAKPADQLLERQQLLGSLL